MTKQTMKRCSLSLSDQDTASLESVGLLMGFVDECGMVNRSKSARFLISFSIRFFELLETVSLPEMLSRLDPESAYLYRLSVLADNYAKSQKK